MKTVKDSACYWLSHVVRKEQGKSIGLSYPDVLRKVQAERPVSGVSLGSLRWYANQIRHRKIGYDLYVLPDMRPRAC